jgi:uncharacterized membrane protein (DUF106 family)
MFIINSILGKIFEIFFLPFINLGLWPAMISVALLTGLLMLFIFKHTSNQAGIRQVKNRIKAHLLELRLFKDSLSVSMKAQGQIVRANFKYMGYSLKPLLVMFIPLILILIQLNFWFAYDSLQSGQTALLKVKFDENISLMEISVEISVSEGIIIETPPLRIEDENEINWRIRARQEGVHDIVFSISGQEFTKLISIDLKKLSRISPLKTKKNFWKELLYPAESPFPRLSPIRSIEVTYPSRNMNLFGWRIHWLIVYFALSIVFGFSLKGFFGVEI